MAEDQVGKDAGPVTHHLEEIYPSRNTWNWGGDETWAYVDKAGMKAFHGPVFPGDVLAPLVTKYLLW